MSKTHFHKEIAVFLSFGIGWLCMLTIKLCTSVIPKVPWTWLNIWSSKGRTFTGPQGSHVSWKTGNTREYRFTRSRSGNVLENKKNCQNSGFTLEIFIESVIF